jgi:hypothetical protein
MQRKQEAYSISLFLLSTINIDDLSFISIIENLFKKREIGKKKKDLKFGSNKTKTG